MFSHFAFFVWIVNADRQDVRDVRLGRHLLGDLRDVRQRAPRPPRPEEVQRDPLDVLRQDVVRQIVADLADVRREDRAHEPARVAGQVDGVAPVLQTRAECGDGVAEGDADGADGVGGEGHGRRWEAVVDKRELVADEGSGVVGDVGEECEGLGVEGKEERSLQQETFE